MPDYRRIFNGHTDPLIKRKLFMCRKSLPGEKVHLAQDRAFFYLNRPYSSNPNENIKISLAFQREVLNQIVSKVQPDLIHCNDWMTGLIPAMARQLDIPCLFSIHNIHSVSCYLSEIEERGIDAASFWQNLYFESYPQSYETARNSIPVDLITSGVFASHYANVMSPTFLNEIIEQKHSFIQGSLRQELANKQAAGCVAGILNAPDPSYNPSTDDSLACKYYPENHVFGKKANKQYVQKALGLIRDSKSPLLFWPSRLDPVQKGCQLLTEILYDVVSQYWKLKLQIIFVADGPFEKHIKDIVRIHGLSDRIAVLNFSEKLSRQVYGAADFVLMPSSFEPCGLPQMIGPVYGTLPIAHDTGGIHDTVTHMDIIKNIGNGFLFKVFDAIGLKWAIDEAIRFYILSAGEKERQIRRIMKESQSKFNYDATAKEYIKLYENMLNRPVVVPKSDKKIIFRKKRLSPSGLEDYPDQLAYCA